MLISPSLLASDFAHFGPEALRAQNAGADWLHLDVMDGHFVPNLSFGPALVAALRPLVRIPLDVHLMISRPDLYLQNFLDAGADTITVHVEAQHDVSATLAAIRAAGRQAGLAFNPPTPFSAVEPYLGQIDLLLAMTVNPGFGGQKFIPGVIPKIHQAVAHRQRHGLSFHIQVDGGIAPGPTAAASLQAGANVLVAGTALFAHPDMTLAIQNLRSSAP